MQWLKKLLSAAAGQQQNNAEQYDVLFCQAIEHSSNGWMLLNKTGDIVYVNRALDALFAALAPELQLLLPELNLRQLKGQNFNQTFQRILHKAGHAGHKHYLTVGRTILTADVHSAASHTSVGHAGSAGVAVEWRSEQACSAAQSLQQSMQRSQLFLATDLQGTTLAANALLSEQLACPAATVVGIKASGLLQLNMMAQQSFQQALVQAAAGVASQLTVQVTSKQGRFMWWTLDCHPELDPTGLVCAAAFYGRDVTTASQTSQAQQQALTALQETLVQLEFSPDGKVLAAHTAYLQLTGFSGPELQGRRYQDLFAETYRQQAEQTQFWHQLMQDGHASAEQPFVKTQGTSLWLLASYAVLRDDSGQAVKVVMYGQDVSQRRAAIDGLQGLLRQLAAGDLTVTVSAPVTAEFPQLSATLSQLITSLHRTIEDIHQAAETITVAATEISAGNTDLSSRTEQQASNLEETASSMEELAGTVRQNSDNSRQANVLAAKAAEVAVNGGQLIDQVVSMMSSINESAQKIADIIGVIDGIAFQTNILALNAAVEAARAGEQGRGFAVVAAEVRTLAQRSANAAKDIKALISDSVGRIRSGNELADRSGATMKDVVTAIKRVNDIMAEIAAASVEQATGLDEISKAVNQMDDMTQQNAALVEQAAAAAESLLSQAEQLTSHVAAFQIDQSQRQVKEPVKSTIESRPASMAQQVALPRQSAQPKSTMNHRATGKPAGRQAEPASAARPAKSAATARVPAASVSTRPNPALIAAAPDGEEWESF